MSKHTIRLEKLEKAAPAENITIRVSYEDYSDQEWQQKKDRGEIITATVYRSSNIGNGKDRNDKRQF